MHHEELFLKANKRYEQQRYADARCLYEMIEPKSSAVWQNLGNCFYYEQRLCDALHAWRKAFKGACRRDKRVLSDALKNLCREHGCSDKLSMYQLSFTERLVHSVPLFLWQCLFLLFWIGLLYAYALSRTRRKRHLLFLSIGLCIIAYSAYYCYQVYQGRIFVTTKGLLYVGPNAQFHHTAQLDEGDEGMLVGTLPGWVKVATKKGTGWLVDTNCTIL
jgi:tetratricopeptide (TPR) repeat protein